MMQKTLADAIIRFNDSLEYAGRLPKGYSVMNPFKDNPETVQVMEAFYRKYYNDTSPRKFIVGINPSRHGAGVTGVPFTDTKRLNGICGIPMTSARTHEVSSVFIYDMIAQYGGAEEFYRHFFINSPFPLAIVRETGMGKQVNANYYDEPALFECVKEFMKTSLLKQAEMGLDTSEVLVMGKKNAEFITKLNKELKLFGSIRSIEHPRFIQQYKSKDKQLYIDKYLQELYELGKHA